MNTEAGSGFTVRALLAGLRVQAREAQRCIVVTNLAKDDTTFLTVHYWPDDATGYCECDAVIRSVAS